MTFGEAEKKFVEELGELYDAAEAKALASVTLSHVCQLGKGQVWLRRDEPLSATQATAVLLILEDLKDGKPLQYIVGETDFFGLRFFVNPSVLIPRPETEELVDWILNELERGRGKYKTVLDIGTGSGCIPITLKKKQPNLIVTGIDVSYDALETATRNAVLNNTDVLFQRLDVLSLEDYQSLRSKYSVIVSNPPYITVSEQQQMHQNVLMHEPHLALFVEDTDPLLFYRKIADLALIHLEAEGLLFFEINEQLGDETVALLNDKGFVNIELRKDIRGRDRMVKASLLRSGDDIE